jgi:hypothetical protein
MNLCVPYITLGKTAEKLSGQYWYSTIPDDPGAVNTDLLKEKTGKITVEEKIYAEAGEISLRDYMKLSAGDKLPINQLDKLYLSAGGKKINTLELSQTADGFEFKIIKKENEPSGTEVNEKLKKEINEKDKSIELLKSEINKLNERLENINFNKKADGINNITESTKTKPFECLKKCDLQELLNYIICEHPQTIALVLSFLGTDKATLLLDALPEELKSDVKERMSMMDAVSPETLREIERVLERKLSSIVNNDFIKPGNS